MADTVATFPAPGTYVIQCAVTTAGGTTTRTRNVVVGEQSVMTFRQGENAYRHEATTLRSETFYSTNNLGSSAQLQVGTSAAGLFRSVLSFDLKALPATAVVHQASLETTTSSSAGSGSVSNLELRSMISSFTEGFGDGNNFPT